jgi:hypothetical protein
MLRINISQGTVLQALRPWVRFPVRSLDLSIDLVLPAALWPCGWLSLYQKRLPGIFLGVKGGRRVRLTTAPPSMSQLSTTYKRHLQDRCLRNAGNQCEGDNKNSFVTLMLSTVVRQQAAWRYVQHDRTLHNYRCENIKPEILKASIVFIVKYT